MTTFKITCRCQECFKKFTFQARSELVDASDVENKPCPHCKKSQQNIGMDVASGKAPAIGGSNVVKAMDIAARDTMEMYGLTDLKSDGREGATMAPSLPPAQQLAADNMFSKKPALPGGAKVTPQMQARINAMKGAALSGAYRDPRAIDPVATIHAKRYRPPIHIVAGS